MRASKSEMTRARIMEAGARVLGQKGYAQSTLEEIAREADTFAGSLYYHFASKDVLVEEIFLEGIYRNTRHLVSNVEAKGADAEPLERLRIAIAAHVTFLLEGDVFSVAATRVYDDLPQVVRDRVLAAYSGFDNYWRDLIADLHRSGGARSTINLAVARQMLLDMLNHSVKWYRPGKLAPDEIAIQASAIFLEGFASATALAAETPPERKNISSA